MATMLKNIAIVSTSLNEGGAERIAGLLSKELSKHYNVYLFLRSTENIVYEYGGTIVDIGQSGPFYEYPIKKYKDMYRIDVAISFLEPMNFANIRTWGKEKVIISERCVQSLMDPPLLAEAYKIGKYYNFADGIVSCSEGVKYDLIQNYGINGKITTIYNFIDKEAIASKAGEDLPGGAADFLDGAEYFINIGRLYPQKNQRRLIMQFSLFHAWKPGIKLLILGSGELEEELASYVEELGLSGSVKIIPYTKNPFSYMAKAKALILSSHYEGLPNAVLEAMALGCPVIATDCLAGPRELLMDEADYEKPLEKLAVGKRGILVCDDAAEDDGTSRYMADAMQLLCSSPSLAEELRKSGQAYMEEYTNRRIVEQWISVIEGCVRKEKQDFSANEESVLSAAEHIVIYGAGLVGKNMFLRLSKRYKIDCFAVSRRRAGENELFGIPIREISEIKYSPEHTAVVMGVSDVYQDDVLRTLQEYGFKNIAFPYIIPLSYDYHADCRGESIKAELADWYRLHTGKDINLDSPKTYNEKIQWLKLHDSTPIKAELADKHAVRDYVARKIGSRYLIPLLGVWDSFDEIPLGSLPDRFVLKCTHGSGTNMLVGSKTELDYEEAGRKFRQWLGMDYSYMGGFEMHYHSIAPKILAEEMLEADDGEDLMDYKVFVFNGKAKLIQVDIGRHHFHRRNLYTPEWEYVPASILYPAAPEIAVDKPACLDELIRISETLGEGFIHVRADFYICRERIYFGELTFTHGSGTEKFEPEEYGLAMGGWMELPDGG